MGWTALFLARGKKVIISDPADGAEEALRRYLEQARPFLEEHGDFDQLTANYEFVRDIVPRLPEADFVQEVGTWRKDIAPAHSGSPGATNTTGFCRTDPSAKSSRDNS